jgi:hypothetical protein
MNKFVVYFENLTFFCFLSTLLFNSNLRQIFLDKDSSLYYVDSSLFVKKIIIPILRIFKVRVEYLKFQMIDIKDDNNELIRYRIPRKDLFILRDSIINSPSFNLLSHETWNQGRISNYINKEITNFSIMNEKSTSRFLFLIQVFHWHMRKNIYNNSIFVTGKKPWVNIYNDYAERHNICLLQVKQIHYFSKIYWHNLIRSNLLLYGLVRIFKYNQFFNTSVSLNSSNKLFIEGRGDINLENNGLHSDLFWHLNSNFPAKNILCKYTTILEKNYLQKHHITAVADTMIFGRGGGRGGRNYEKPQIQINNSLNEESLELNTILESYDIDRYYWSNFFKKYDVKIFLTWFKCGSTHMAIADAVKENGGIAVLWQLSFQGFVETDSKGDFDISFCYSKFDHEIETAALSNNKYTIITGYQRDHASLLNKSNAASLRKKLCDHGAEKIIFAIDENSVEDSRWHTGHKLQQDNYSYILEKVLDIPWLGVIFKPKSPISLRQRLGSINNLLEKAEETGRCYIYEISGQNTSLAPPVLAALSSDICVSGHLGAGTAALECALAGVPTLLIDREGCPESKLYELPEGKVIFKDWPSAIEGIMENFNSPSGIDGFGDWSSIINDLDPFRDGNAAKRMGTYLHCLIKGFEDGLDREAVMENAAEIYKKQWGNDKVLVS